MMISGQESPIIMPFEGFRERIHSEKVRRRNNGNIIPEAIIDTEKKSLSADILRQGEPDNGFLDEERLAAHFRKYKAKAPPYTAEYITSNRFSDLDAEIRSNALEKYKQSIAEKTFPFEYENPGEISEQRIYIDEDDIPVDAGSGDPYNLLGKL